MKKILFTLCVLYTLTGCTSINNFIDDALPAKAPVIPVALQEQIASKVNPENEIFAVASANIDKSGSLIAQAKANKYSRQLLKRKLEKEIKINFNSFLVNTDSYTKGIITPVIPDLVNYAMELSLKNATPKGEWEGNNAIFSLIAIDRNKVFDISKQVFSGYIGDVSGKLNSIKSKVTELK